MTHGDDRAWSAAPAGPVPGGDRADLPDRRGARRGARSRASGSGRSSRRPGIRAHVDARDGMKPGAKYYEWEGGASRSGWRSGRATWRPARLMLARRTGGKKESLPLAGLPRRADGRRWSDAAGAAGDGAGTPRGRTASGARPRSSSSPLEAGGGFVYSGFCGRRHARRRSRSRPRRRSGCCPTRSSGRRRCPRPACGAEGPA